MGEFSVDVYCGKLCGCGGVRAFIDGSSGAYPPTFASMSATASAILSTSLMITARYFGRRPAGNRVSFLSYSRPSISSAARSAARRGFSSHRRTRHPPRDNENARLFRGISATCLLRRNRTLDKMDISRRVTSGERHRLSISAGPLFDFSAKFLGLMFHAFTVRIARDLLQPAAQLSGHARMASETEGSDVFNSAFTASFDDGHNMVGRPGAYKRLEPWELPPKHIERPVTLRLAVHFPGELRRLKPRLSQQCLKDPQNLIAIGSTKRADSEIALKDLFPKVARIAA
jgi:hypothetical protein